MSVERKENLFQPPEYTAEMFAEYFEIEKARALRVSEIEAILGDDYDLDRLQELVEADRDGRCVFLPVKIGTHVWSTVFCRLSDDGKEHPTFPWEFSVSMMDECGTGWHLTEKDAEKALEGETHDNSL